MKKGKKKKNERNKNKKLNQKNYEEKQVKLDLSTTLVEFSIIDGRDSREHKEEVITGEA